MNYLPKTKMYYYFSKVCSLDFSSSRTLIWFFSFLLVMHRCVYNQREWLYSCQESFWYSNVLLQVKNNAKPEQQRKWKKLIREISFRSFFPSSALEFWTKRKNKKDESWNGLFFSNVLIEKKYRKKFRFSA